MANKILIGIGEALDDNFSDVTIEAGDVNQGFKTPAFYISLFNFQKKERAVKMGSKNHTFEIKYFPKSKEPLQELLETADRVSSALKVIRVGDIKARAKEIEINVSDDVLVILAKYDCYFKEVHHDDLDLMKYLKERRRMKWQKSK